MKEINIHTKKTSQSPASPQPTGDDLLMQFSLFHDLKEPIRMVSVYSQLLEKKLNATESLDNDSADYLQFIREGALRLNKMVDGMAHLAQLSNNPEAIQDIDIEDVLYFVQKNLRLFIAENNASIKQIGSLPHVKARYSEMVRVFQNILENAIKFKSPNRTCSIKISGRITGTMAIFEIEDNGIGIPAHEHKRIFQPFQHAVSGEKNIEGSGLGLTICKHLIEGYNGSISLQSTEGEGSVFRISLPNA